MFTAYEERLFFRKKLLAHLFAKKSTMDRQGKQPLTIPVVEPSMTEQVSRQRTMRRILNRLYTKKAFGHDGITPLILKKCVSELTSVLILNTFKFRGHLFKDTPTNNILR